MRIVKNITFITLLIIVFLNSFSFVSAQSDVDQLVVAIHRDENTLSPFTYVTGNPGIETVRLIFDSLFTLDPDSEAIPWMVSDYTIDEDYQVYEITLHNDLKWHDGKSVTASDVAFSYTYPLTQNYTRWRKIAEQVDTIDIFDDQRLRIILNGSNQNFIDQGMADLPIIPKHIYENVEDAQTVSETIGSGMYKLVEYKRDQFYKFERVQDYFIATPTVKQLIMPIMTDMSSIFQALRAEQIAATTALLAPELVTDFRDEQNINVLSGAGLNVTLLQFNNEVYPFSESIFRQAIALAIDQQDIIDTVLLGYGDRASLGFSHPSLPWGREDLVIERDVKKSNQLLDEIGFEQKNQSGIRLDDNDKALEFDLLVYANNPLRIRTAQLIAEHLQEVGIEVNVVSLEPGTMDDLVYPGFDVTQGRDYDMAIWGWSAPVQLRSNMLVELFTSELSIGSLNIGAFTSEAFDLLSEQLRNTLDLEERMAIIDDMQQVIADEVPLVTLFFPQQLVAYNQSLYDQWVIPNGGSSINKFSFLPNDEIGVREVADQSEVTIPTQKSNRLWLLMLIPMIFFIGMKRKRRKTNA